MVYFISSPRQLQLLHSLPLATSYPARSRSSGSFTLLLSSCVRAHLVLNGDSVVLLTYAVSSMLIAIVIQKLLSITTSGQRLCEP